MNYYTFLQLALAVLVGGVSAYTLRKGIGLDARTWKVTGAQPFWPQFAQHSAMFLIAFGATWMFASGIFQRQETRWLLAVIDWVGASCVGSYFLIKLIVRLDPAGSYSGLHKLGLFFLFAPTLAFGIMILYGIISVDL